MTHQEMMSMKIPIEDRTFCVDKLAEYRACYHVNFPLQSWYCPHQKHEYIACTHEE
jgi:NADH dehydrogenase (ubiquinone) 1 beta subcomplex subunit 7